MNKHQSILINPRLFEIMIQNQNQKANLGQSFNSCGFLFSQQFTDPFKRGSLSNGLPVPIISFLSFSCSGIRVTL